MSATALRIVKALADDDMAEVWGGDDDLHESALSAAPEDVQRDAARVDRALRFEIEDGAAERDEDLDDHEIEELLRRGRLQHWLGRLSPAEAAEALAYRLGLLVQAVSEFGEFAAMIVDRQPALRDPVAQASARLLHEFDRIFGHLEKAGGAPAAGRLAGPGRAG